MDQNKIGDLIKKLRKENKLTQEKFAEKYGVTYQAVSKWENGKNIPDISLLKQICVDFNIDINDLLEGNNRKKKKTTLLIIIISITIILGVGLILIFNQDNFTFGTLTTSCSDFKISGSVAYNNTKSYLYISNVDYCGDENNITYKKIECTLYEKKNDIKKTIGKFDYDKEKEITLNAFLSNVTFKIDDFSKECNNIKNDTLYLEINATDNNDKITTYKVPLDLNESCF